MLGKSVVQIKATSRIFMFIYIPNLLLIQKRLTLLVCLLMLMAIPLSAQEETQQTTSQLMIGTKIAKPFAMKDEDGRWYGISIELWEKIAKKLNIDYSWQEETLDTLLNDVSNGSLDAGIAAITITADREKNLDFSHSYYATGLSIATPKNLNDGWKSIIRGIFSMQMLFIILLLLAILLVIGTFTWLIERKKNPDNFHPNPIRGIASGIWWAAVTMTTVGYGDMTPRTFGGRLIALFWMFSSLLIVSAIIGSVASTLTIAKGKPLIASKADLYKGRLASIKHSSSDAYLKKHKLKARYYKTVLDALTAIDKGEVDAIVYDDPLLKYLTTKHFNNRLNVINDLFEPQHYGIIFPEGSPLREPVNRAMLEIIHRDEWQRVLQNYLGAK